MILNGSHSDIPLITRGKQLGFEVITLGNDINSIGHKYADKHINVDYSDKSAVLECAKKENIDYICSCANDFGILSACYVAEKLNLPGHDDFEVCTMLHHKDKFKKLVKKYNLLSPNAEDFDDVNKAIDYSLSKKGKVVIKPIDLGGGKGVSTPETNDEKKESISLAFKYSRQKKVVVEDFINGTNHSMTVFLINGKVRYCFTDNEYYYKNNFLCCTSLGPADRIDSYKNRLLSECEKIAKILNLVDGHLHLQYRLDDDNNPWIIEYTRRMAGDLFSYPVELALGIDESMYIVKAECGLNISDLPYMPIQSGYVGRHCFMTPQNGVIESYDIDKELEKYITYKLDWFHPNYVIDDYMKDKFGIIIFDFKTKDNANKFIPNISSFIKYNYKK